MNSFFRKLGWLASRRSREEQLADELRFHLEEETAERESAGLPAAEARLAARRELGNLAAVQEETRAAWGWTPVEQCVQDLRYALRTMARTPAFPVLAALSLALGIGANTAIYSFMDALLLRRLPVADAGSLVVLKWRLTGGKNVDDSVLHSISGQVLDDSTGGSISDVFPFRAFEELQKPRGVLSDLFAYRPARKLDTIVEGQAEIQAGEYVSGGFFRGLGVVPAAGRLVSADDDRAGAPSVVVLSFGFARDRFGDPAAALGHSLAIDNYPFTVIGVAPRGFAGVDPSKSPNLFLPLHSDLLIDPGRGNGYADEHYYWTQMMGRLRPGVGRAQAQKALAPAFQSWIAGTAATPLERRNLPELLLADGAYGLDNLRRDYAEPFWVLLAVVGLILVIACANIANLLLARAASRRREMAVRLSLGAGRWRVLRQLLTESLLLAVLGGGAGVLLAVGGIRLLGDALAGASGTFPLQAALNWRVLAAASLLTALTGLLFGLGPALRATRLDPMPVLKEMRVAGRGRRAWLGLNLSGLLVAGQMAICLLLLVGAGLFLRTLTNLQALDPGFARDHVLLFRVNAQQAGHRSPEILTFYEELERRLAAIPGVRAAAMANSPLIGGGAWGWPIVPVGQGKPEKAPTGHGSGASRASTRVLGVGPGFFAAMRIPLLAGREFDRHDRHGAPAAAIVNQAWVKVNLPGENPVGRHVTSYGLRDKPQEMEIVGVARNARYDDLTGDFPSVVYLPVEQNLDVPVEEMTFYLRTAGNPAGYAGAVRAIVHQADARIPVAGLTTQTAQIGDEIVPETVFARLCTAFALLSLAIACVGLYGTTSYAVARRTGEIGIRMALGARRGSVVWMVLRDVMALAVLGLAIALPAARIVSKLVESLLFGIQPGDPVVLASAAAILLAATVAAGFLPARRASRIDPMIAVRHE